MPEQFLPSSSAIVNITALSPPYADPVSFTGPAGLEAGVVPQMVTVRLMNTGGSAGECYADVWDNDTGERLWASPRQMLDAGQFFEVEVDLPPMPDRNWGLVAQGHSNGGIDGTGNLIIQILATDVLTTLVLGLSKTFVEIGETYMFSGYLRKSGVAVFEAGIQGQSVVLRRGIGGIWQDISAVITDAMGYYEGSTSLTDQGSYEHIAVYEGGMVAGVLFLGSSSRIRRLRIRRTVWFPKLRDRLNQLLGRIPRRT